MKIELLTMWYNEEFLAPFFLKHYRFVDKIHIFLDSDTNDKTRDVIEVERLSHNNIVVHDFKFPDMMNDIIKMNHLNEFYKTIEDGYVFIADADEFIFYEPGYLDNHEDSVHFTRLWNVYRHKDDKDLDVNLPVRLQRQHGTLKFDNWDIYTKPNIARAGLSFNWLVGHHCAYFNCWLVDYTRPEECKTNGVSWGTPIQGAHWSMADPSFAVERRLKGRRDRQSKYNLDNGLTVQHHGVTEESLLQSLKQHENDPKVL
jgi:hypothetical protein